MVFGFNLISVLQLLAGFVVAFLIAVYWLSIDRRTEAKDKDYRQIIEEDPHFRGVRESDQSDFIVTSNSNTSRARSILRRLQLRPLEKPKKIVQLPEQSIEERHKAILAERAKEVVPGKKILQDDLFGALQNYIAYRLSLANEAPNQVVTHFQRNLEEYDYADRVQTLGKQSHFESISLINTSNEELTPLDDVYFPLVRRAELHCVDGADDVSEKEVAIEDCREFLMLSLWGLYRQKLKGVIADGRINLDDCENKCRRDIREENNVGYWLVTDGECDEDEFEEFRHLGYRFKRVIDKYWNFENCYQLHPPADDIPSIPFVETPFFIFRKDKGEFGPENDPQRERKSGDPRYRRKEEYQN